MKMFLEEKKLHVIIDSDELPPYGICIEDFVNFNPMPCKLFDEIFAQAAQKYGVKLNKHCMNIISYPKFQQIELTWEQESNIVQMKNVYTEECSFLEAMESLFRFLPDEKIVMDVPEKKKVLKKIRNGKGKDLLRKQFL